MATIKNITEAEFETTVADGVVLADFWAPWCNPCKMLGAILEQAAKDAPESAVIAKINVDENKELAAKMGVSTLPTLMLYKNGKVVKEMTGVQSRTRLVDILTNA